MDDYQLELEDIKKHEIWQTAVPNYLRIEIYELLIKYEDLRRLFQDRKGRINPLEFLKEALRARIIYYRTMKEGKQDFTKEAERREQQRSE